MIQLLSLLFFLIGCQPALLHTVTVQVSVRTDGFQIQASSKQATDIHHFTIKLYRQADNQLTATGTLLAGGSYLADIHNLPDGTYYATADAFESMDDSASITQGGPQTSANRVTVNAPAVTYSDAGTGLAVMLRLLDSTGGVAAVAINTSLSPASYQAWLQDQTGSLRAPYTSSTPAFHFGFIPDGPFRAVASLTFSATHSTPNRLADQVLTFADGIASPASSYAITIPGLLISLAGGAGIGDGGAPTQATLNGPQKVAVAGDGTIYIADTLHHRIRQVTGETITTLAGTGVAGYAGDGGPANQAQLNTPSGLALDATGNLYVADTGNRVIRKITPAGTIASFAGTGQNGSQGDGGPATSARLSFPSDVAVAGNAVYIADTANHKVRVVDASGTISTLAGRGQPGYTGDGAIATNARLRSPEGVAVSGGVVYIADTGNHVIRQVTGGTITTVMADQGLNTPQDLALDGSDLLVADSGNNAIRRISAGVVTTLVSGLANPGGVALTAGVIWIADTNNHLIKRLSAGNLSTVAGHPAPGADGDQGPAVASTLLNPQGITGSANGTLWTADTGHHRLRQIENGVITPFAGDGTAGFSGDGGSALIARFNQPTALAIDSSNAVYVADTGNHRIRRILGGIVSSVAGNGSTGVLNGPQGLAIASNGDLFIADTGNHLIKKLAAGLLTTVAGDGSPSVLNGPTSLSLAPNGDLYVADTGNHRIQVLSGSILSVVVTGLNGPKGVAVGSGGDLLIADTNNHRLLRRDSSGNITTVSGTGTAGLGSDNAAAYQALLNQPTQLWSAPLGQLIFCDTANHRIRLI